MARLRFDGKVAEYHPATGLEFQPGVAEYPDQHEAALMATGRFTKVQAKVPVAEKEKE
jgi:hypothetical protein